MRITTDKITKEPVRVWMIADLGRTIQTFHVKRRKSGDLVAETPLRTWGISRVAQDVDSADPNSAWLFTTEEEAVAHAIVMANIRIQRIEQQIGQFEKRLSDLRKGLKGGSTV